MSKLKLWNITLIICDCYNYGGAVSSLKKSMEQCEFAAVKFLTDIDIEIEGVEVVKIPKIKSVQEYSSFIIKQLNNYFDTDFVLISQHDSWVIDANAWTDEFFNFDVVGSTWGYKDGRNVGQGGFCLHSKRLHKALSSDPNIQIHFPDDEVIARLYRGFLEKKYGIRYATEELANQFAFELNEPTAPTFGFHSFFHDPFKKHIVIKRTAAMGDLIMALPVLDYYYEKGYQVVLDTLPEMMAIFFNHPYRIKHISEMHPNIVPEKVINLDQSYESKPKQNVLKTYYEFAGIKDGVMRNSRLNVNQEYHHRLFKQYIVFHIDRTGNMPYRDVYGVNWNFVNQYYNKLGYTCIQVGKGAHEEVGLYFHSETREMLMYLLAGSSAVCGIDSGVAQLAVALDRPTAIFFGSVNPELRYQDFSKIEVIKNACPKPEHEFCYHNAESSLTGAKCKIDEKAPPCTNFSEYQVVKALNKLLKI